MKENDVLVRSIMPICFSKILKVINDNVYFIRYLITPISLKVYDTFISIEEWDQIMVSTITSKKAIGGDVDINDLEAKQKKDFMKSLFSVYLVVEQ